MNAEERAKFLAERRNAIGGSDAAAIAGLSPWATPVDVYNRLVNGVEDEISSDVLARGNELEPAVLAAYEAHTGIHTVQHVGVLYHDQHPWAMAHVDALGYGDEGRRVVEAKTSTNADAWAEGVPTHVVCQAQHYLGVTDAKRADVSVLLASERTFSLLRHLLREAGLDAQMLGKVIAQQCDFRIYTLERDQEFIDALFATEEKFWTDHVLAKVPPHPTTSDQARALYPVATPDLAIEAEGEAYGLVLSMPQLKADLEKAQRNLDQCQAGIQAYMGAASDLTVNGKRVATWRQQSRKGVDTKALLEANPEIVKQYEKTSSFRVFRMSGVKE